ncbi:hypothetical protein Landi51_05829 [Colletotrichum acutatum]
MRPPKMEALTAIRQTDTQHSSSTLEELTSRRTIDRVKPVPRKDWSSRSVAAVAITTIVMRCGRARR